MTNLDQYSATSDAIQLRPFEVLVEEWARLRREVGLLLGASLGSVLGDVYHFFFVVATAGHSPPHRAVLIFRLLKQPR